MAEVETTTEVTSESICADSISSESYNQANETAKPGLITRVAGSAYNTTAYIAGGTKNVAAPVLGGAVKITGVVLTTSFGFAKSFGSYMLPARFKTAEPKDKSD